MPAPVSPPPRRRDVDAGYSYRRPLALREVLPALGIGIGVGLFAFYVSRLLLQRTPLRPAGRAPRVRARVVESSLQK